MSNAAIRTLQNEYHAIQQHLTQDKKALADANATVVELQDAIERSEQILLDLAYAIRSIGGPGAENTPPKPQTPFSTVISRST